MPSPLWVGGSSHPLDHFLPLCLLSLLHLELMFQSSPYMVTGMGFCLYVTSCISSGLAAISHFNVAVCLLPRRPASLSTLAILNSAWKAVEARSKQRSKSAGGILSAQSLPPSTANSKQGRKIAADLLSVGLGLVDTAWLLDPWGLWTFLFLFSCYM